MNIPCDQSILCLAGNQTALGYDAPLINFSSELPDANISIGYYPGNPQDPPALGTNYTSPGCVAWCTSSVSQQEADLCAAAQQASCSTGGGNTGGSGGGGGGGGGTPSNPMGAPQDNTSGLFGNEAQTCVKTCPDGTNYTSTIDAGKVSSTSLSKANEIAYSLACKDATAKMKCNTAATNLFACADPNHENAEYSYQFSAPSGNPPLTWSVSGSLPPGIALETSGLLHGYPSKSGTYAFTVTSTDASSASTKKQCSFNVLGLNDSSGVLADAKVDNTYSIQLMASGGTGITFAITSGSLPGGLSMSSSGLISGVPPNIGSSLFTVTMTDSNGNSCSIDEVLEVTGPKIICPPAGFVCQTYSGSVTTIPAGCTFSGTPPDCLVLNPTSGAISGIPASTDPFVITASYVDSHGKTQTNSKSCSFITVQAGTIASRPTDMKWSFVNNSSGGNASGGGSGPNCSIQASGSCSGTPPTASNLLGGGQVNSELQYCCGAAYRINVTASWAGGGSDCNPSNHAGATAHVTVGYDNGGGSMLDYPIDLAAEPSGSKTGYLYIYPTPPNNYHTIQCIGTCSGNGSCSFNFTFSKV